MASLQINRKRTKEQEECTHNYATKQLTPLYIRFINEYLANGQRVGWAYHVAANKQESTPTKSSGNSGTRLLRYDCVKSEINARLEASGITQDKINARLWEIAQYKGVKTLNAAVQALTTLARIRGMIKPEGANTFFADKMVIFQPIASREEADEFAGLLKQGNVTE